MVHRASYRAVALAGAALGALLFAASAWILQTTEIPTDPEADFAAAIERVNERLDWSARLSAVGLGLLLAGIGGLALLATVPDPRHAKRQRIAGWSGLGAAAVVLVARLRAVSADQFGNDWDGWLGLEALAFTVASLAFAAVAWLAWPRERATPADLVHPVDAGRRGD